MITQLFILKESGQCIVHVDFRQLQSDTKEKINPQLISGFFAAIMTFAQTTNGDDNSLDHISMKNLNYYFCDTTLLVQCMVFDLSCNILNPLDQIVTQNHIPYPENDRLISDGTQQAMDVVLKIIFGCSLFQDR